MLVTTDWSHIVSSWPEEMRKNVPGKVVKNESGKVIGSIVKIDGGMVTVDITDPQSEETIKNGVFEGYSIGCKKG